MSPKAPIASALFLSALSCIAHAQVALIGTATIPGTTLDRSGQAGSVLDNTGKDTGTSQALFGGAGSAIDYTGADNLYLMCPDRGPSNGEVQYADRVHSVRILVQPGAATPLSVSLVETTLLKNASGISFTGSAAAFKGNPSFQQPESLRLDPEGLRLAHDSAHPGAFWISDEYGPFVFQFDRQGKQINAFPLPPKFLCAHPNADDKAELANNTLGRQPNRGMEGLAISPDGKTLIGLMQSPLIQDHGIDASAKRIGTLSRIITMNLADDSTHEYVYPMESDKFGMNEILAIDDHQFLIIERDGKAGLESASKKIFRINLAGATDISAPFTAGGTSYDYSGTTPANGLPLKAPIPGVKPVSKSLLIDMLDPALHLAQDTFPEKIEGLAWGPDFDNGDKLLIVTSDNDFIPTSPTWFFAFRIPKSEILGTR